MQIPCVWPTRQYQQQHSTHQHRLFSAPKERPQAVPPSLIMVTTRSTGSGASAWDPAAKARMIAHMNKDHSQDLSHILQHFNGLSADGAADAQMIDVDASSLTVSSRSGVHTVVLDPVLEWDARRQRLIDLTMEARQGLGIPSDDGGHGGPASTDGGSAGSKGGNVVVRRYTPPKGWQWIPFLGLVFYYASSIALYAGLIAPGTLLWRLLEASPYPGGPEAFCWLVNKILVLVLGIHIVESWWLDRTRLNPNGVARGTPLWWLWMSSCFVEGTGSFLRFDEEVGRLRAEGKQK